MTIPRLASLSTVACLPILMSVSCSNQGNLAHAQHETTRVTIVSLQTATALYQIECGAYPAEQEGLSALVLSPGNTNWHGPYVDGDKIPTDAWGNPFSYRLSNGLPVIVSAGADGQFDTDDDVNKDSKYRSRTF